MSGRVSQDVLKPLALGAPDAHVSQLVTEPLAVGAPSARISQIVLEPLIVNLEVELLVYPTLPGLAYNVGWNTSFFNMPTSTTSSGADIDLGIAQYPLHDFELTYEFLRDAFGFMEQKTMRGFFMAIAGSLGRFLFRNPHDYCVKQQIIGTGDGTTRLFTLIRTYGAGEYSSSEPIGMIDDTAPFNAYLDGVPLSAGSDYTRIESTPCLQQIQFATAPSNGQVITVDMAYFYYCKLADSKLTMEEFLHQIWTLNKIVLHSCRPGA